MTSSVDASNETVYASRRIVFHGVVGLGALVALTGCGGGGEESGSGAESSSPSASASESSSASAKASSGGAEPLAATSEIPVGGGVIFPDQRIVVTQPKKGTFEGYSAACTHQGFTVTSVEDGTISCNHHGSSFDAATGEVKTGPATNPLESVKLRVDGDSIFAA